MNLSMNAFGNPSRTMIQTVRQAGLAGLTGAELLDAAQAAKFEVFLALDTGLDSQPNFTGDKIALILLHPRSARLGDLLQLVPNCLDLLPSLEPGEVATISIDASEPD